MGQPKIAKSQGQPEDKLEPSGCHGHFQGRIAVDDGLRSGRDGHRFAHFAHLFLFFQVVSDDLEPVVQRRVEEATIEPVKELVNLSRRDSQPGRKSLGRNVATQAAARVVVPVRQDTGHDERQ